MTHYPVMSHHYSQKMKNVQILYFSSDTDYNSKLDYSPL